MLHAFSQTRRSGVTTAGTATKGPTVFKCFQDGLDDFRLFKLKTLLLIQKVVLHVVLLGISRHFVADYNVFEANPSCIKTSLRRGHGSFCLISLKLPYAIPSGFLWHFLKHAAWQYASPQPSVLRCFSYYI